MVEDGFFKGMVKWERKLNVDFLLFRSFEYKFRRGDDEEVGF